MRLSMMVLTFSNAPWLIENAWIQQLKKDRHHCSWLMKVIARSEALRLVLIRTCARRIRRLSAQMLWIGTWRMEMHIEEPMCNLSLLQKASCWLQVTRMTWWHRLRQSSKVSATVAVLLTMIEPRRGSGWSRWAASFKRLRKRWRWSMLMICSTRLSLTSTYDHRSSFTRARASKGRMMSIREVLWAKFEELDVTLMRLKII